MSKISLICKYVSFGSIAILILYMAAMTVLEKIHGTDTAMKFGYESIPFTVLWAVSACSGITYYLYRTKGRPMATTGIHVSFIIILIGALITHIWGEYGTVHLRTGEESAATFTNNNGNGTTNLPFNISLEDFRIDYYPGTYAPRDYICKINISDNHINEELQISMNRTESYLGYRFFLSGYDDDGKGSTIAVSHDLTGISVTYTGYALLILSMIGFFFQRQSRFRCIVKSLSRITVILVLMICSAVSCDTIAKEKDELPDHLPVETASEYGKILIMYNDRICPVQTLARDFTRKLYGKTSYMGLTPEQVLTGWIFYYDDWKHTLIEPKSPSSKDQNKYQEKEELSMLVSSAVLLKIFPYSDNDTSPTWYSSVDRLPSEMSERQWLFIRKVMSLASEAIAGKNYEAAGAIFRKINEYQEKTAGKVLPGQIKTEAERIYNTIEKTKAASAGCLLAGLIFFAVFSLCSKPMPFMKFAGTWISILVSFYLTLVLVLRWYISGHIPMSNGFEVMVSLAWMSILSGTALHKRFPIMLPISLLLCGFALLVASIGENDPAIAYLVPVLSSPLLSIHVSTMMISYTFLGLVMLNSAYALVRHRCCEGRMSDSATVSLAFLYPAVFFLASGIFTGAVWADISWGRYWGWDPKEVWALITLLTYSLAFHSNSIRILRKPTFFHWFCVIAFLCVIITYFGVNLILGGQHSYA